MRAESCRSAQLGKTRRATDQEENVPCAVWGHGRWGAVLEVELVLGRKASGLAMRAVAVAAAGALSAVRHFSSLARGRGFGISDAAGSATEGVSSVRRQGARLQWAYMIGASSMR